MNNMPPKNNLSEIPLTPEEQAKQKEKEEAKSDTLKALAQLKLELPKQMNA